MIRGWRLVFVTAASWALALSVAAPAFAHNEPISTSRFRASAADGALGCTITFTGPDVVTVGHFDAVELPEEGTKVREDRVHERILAEVGKAIAVENDGVPCAVTPLQVFGRKGYEVSLRWQCPKRLGTLGVTMRFLDLLPSDHQHLLEFDPGTRQGPLPPPPITSRLDRSNPTFTHVFPLAVGGASGQGAPGHGASVAASRRVDDQSVVTSSPELSFVQAIQLGLHHIASGPDHLLFILGILLVARRLRLVVALATTFTVAHSTTLALAALRVATISSAVVEPLIAASLVVIAFEALPRGGQREPGRLSAARRVTLVFGFGLLHGLGFAGGLVALDLSGAALAKALLGFNVGVELGQLAVAAVGIPVLALLGRKPWYQARIGTPAALGIAACGLYWTVARVWGA